MQGAGPSRVVAAVILGSYTAAAAGVTIWSLLEAGDSRQSLLSAALRQPVAAAIVFAPVILGLIVQWAGRRLWAWPYVYLVAFGLALGSQPVDVGDDMYLHTSAVVWVLTVFVAESVGLGLGRWLHRFVGIAFFLGAGAWLLVAGLGPDAGGAVGRWQAWILTTAGALFLLHAAFQLLNHLRARSVPPAASVAEVPVTAGSAADDAAPAAAVARSEPHEEWTFHPLGRLHGRKDSKPGKEDNETD